MATRRKNANPIYIAEEQIQQIDALVDSTLMSNTKTPEFIACLRALKIELDKAKVVPAAEIPADVVRVGSWIELEDLGDGYVDRYQLVFPEHADLSRGRISLMTPMAIGLIGEPEGREVSYQAPSGVRKIRIRRVSVEPFEPEAPRPETPVPAESE